MNGVDLSDHVESLTLEVGQENADNTPMGSIQRYGVPGMQTITNPTMTFYQDYATGKVYATLVALWQGQTIFNVVCKADAGARALTNPEWTVPVYLAKMPVLMGRRGDRHLAPVTCAAAGLATIATS